VFLSYMGFGIVGAIVSGVVFATFV
jgi:hypothetical protein